MSYEVGDKIGDYEIVGTLGKGGMGLVYKVRNVISERVEAMKILLPNLEHEPELADRFLREIKVLATLDHPNIAALRTALRAGNQLVMVMELVEGISLDEKVRQGPIPIGQAIDYFCQALTALSYAHGRGVIHRDIKPANIMITPGGLVKLMDFGIAKGAGDRKLTQTGTTLGSLYYMSPEQVSGAPLDKRSDLYSMGVSLYEVLTGTRPFQGDSDFSIMAAHLEGNVVPPIQVNPLLPPELNEIIMIAITKDPEQRFQSADAFRGALETVGRTLGMTPRAAAAPAHTAVAAPPPVAVPSSAPVPLPQPAAAPPASQPAAAAKSHRGLYMALGAVLALGVLVVAATQLPRWLRTRAVETQTVAPAPQPPAPSAPEPTTPQAAPAEPAPAAPQQPEPAAAPLKSEPARPQPPAAKVRTRPAEALPAARPGTQPPPAAAPAAVQAEKPVQPAPEAPAPPAAAQQLHDRMVMLASRAAAVKTSLENLQRQQTAAGLSLRADISASWKRMEYYMDQSESALNRSDAAAAKRNMDLAEREIDKLESFLGR